MVARLATAEAMVSTFRILAMETRSLLAMKGAAGPIIAARLVRLAAIPSHATRDHLRNRYPVAYLVKEGLWKFHSLLLAQSAGKFSFDRVSKIVQPKRELLCKSITERKLPEFEGG